MARRLTDLLPLAILLLVAGVWVYVTAWMGAGPAGKVVASFDIYAAHFPNLIYALESLRRGHGLLWNSLQNCGQPFLPSTLVGLLYPLHLVFLLVPVDTGFVVITVLHLALGGGFTYWLCREHGVQRTAALCGGLVFMLGGASVRLASWVPTTILGPYVWLPAAAATTERILRRPTRANAIGLGACLTMSLLGGYPQVTFFICQFIALRVLWEMATNRAARRLSVLGALAVGGVLPVLLGAAYLLPAMEFAATSVRGGRLSPSEIGGGAPWKRFALDGGAATNGFVPILTLVPTVLVTLAFTRRTQWRMAAFHVMVAVLYLALALSPRLFDLYSMLPLGGHFRDPTRFLWMAAFAFVVPVALGVDALARPRSMAITGAGLVLGVLVFALVSTRPYFPVERWCLGLVAVVALSVAARRRDIAVLSAALPVLVALNLFALTTRPFLRRLSDPHVVYRHADAFAFVRERITPLDRIYVLGVHPDFSLMDKSGSVFGLPAITDYEPQTSRRYAGYTVRMIAGRPMQRINDFYYRGKVPLARPLFDLAGARWVIVDVRAFPPANPLADLPTRWARANVRVLENPAALPRAFYVPRLEVRSRPEVILEDLAGARRDPRRAALVEQVPADGFVGTADPTAAGRVESLQDQSERLSVRLTATQEGFLVLSDQDYPGWVATVNGSERPILRANYAFRAVRVPSGASEVVFRYRPRSIRYGILISLASLGIVVWALRAHRQ